ncbi:hypothetical protein MTO96_010196 [Rhipicephalus appendiculatus]
MADSSCPAFFKRASSPVSLPISHLGPTLRHPCPSPPAIERPSPYGGHLDGPRSSSTPSRLDIRPALGAPA